MADPSPRMVRRHVLAIRCDYGRASAEVAEWCGLEGLTLSVHDDGTDARLDLTWEAAVALHTALGALLDERGPRVA